MSFRTKGEKTAPSELAKQPDTATKKDLMFFAEL
jgi:hypothetical protein